MHVNYADTTTAEIESIDVEPTGDKRKTVEKAIQRFFRSHESPTLMYRASLIAAGMTDTDENHPHYHRYRDIAEKIQIETEWVSHWNARIPDEFEVLRVKIDIEGK